ncbi:MULTISPECIES: hypothetical protein [Metabacillus]|uniref:DUF4901 domain-containing protein n=2 Tax=Metabacillus TaxID=2675233 RepID=A0A179SP25_9BACI|nr:MULTISPECIES: hypothetical protein [Metabacillus]OAS82740.1 hypothetical protein A6K24_11500 [Metabacillus litoralis]QNF30181.1 hypothetical protein HUW50_23600 [Metabacillus sp. KUDC1714]
MNSRIEEIIEFTKTKFRLANYYLERHSLYRNVNIFNDTVYTLCMEWFPNHVTEQEVDENPEGTAVIEINVNTHKFESAIFVMGETYAIDGITFANLDAKTIIEWVERETGLTYGKQFQLHKETEGELQFKECFEGIAVSPSGFIDVKFNQEGKLTSFSVHGQFPPKEMVKEGTYTLLFEEVEHLAKEQLKLIEFPSYEQKKLVNVYAVEEIYVMNDGTSTIPFEIIADVRSYLKINKTLLWDEPINKPFNRKEISWVEDITVEQAFSAEPSPVSFPITKEEEEKCVMAVEELLRQEYPNDTGKWMLKTLHRDKGYIHAIVRANHQNNHVFQRKLMIMIDTQSLQAVNYMDNKPMLEIYDQFQEPDKVTITKEEAFEKIKDLFELKPYYVYDFEQRKYVLCGKLDCQFGVNAGSGKVISLDDL